MNPGFQQLLSIESYLYISIGIGILQIGDGWLLARSLGKVSVFSGLFGLLEYVWAGYSVYLAYQSSHWPMTMWWYVCAFLAYVVLMFVWGIRISKQQLDMYEPAGAKSLRVPKVIAQLGIAFGSIYAGAGLVILWNNLYL